MPTYDLAGNPIPEEELRGSQPNSQPPGMQPLGNYGQPAAQYDLAGNPIQSQSPSPQYGSPPGPAMRPMGSSMSQLGGSPVAPPPPAYGQAPYGGQYGQPGSPAPGGAPGAYGGAPGVYGGAPAGGGQYGRASSGGVTDEKKRMIGYGIAGLLAIAIIVVIVVANIPQPLPATTGFTHYADPWGQFNCDGPDDWAVISSETLDTGSDVDTTTATGGVLFKRNAAKIDVTTGIVADLTARQLFSAGDGTQALTGSKIQPLADFWEPKIKSGYNGFTAVNTLNDGFSSKEIEFTANGPKFGFPQALHGYIAEMVWYKHDCVVVATCPESDWTNAKPVFDHVINTLGEGGTPVNHDDLGGSGGADNGAGSGAGSGAPVYMNGGGDSGSSSAPVHNLDNPTSMAAPATNAARGYGMGQ